MKTTSRVAAFVCGAVLAFATRAIAEDGGALFAQGHFAEAREAFQAAVDKNAKDAAAHAGLVRSRLRLDEWPDALREARRAVESLPGDATLHALLGTALRRAGKLRDAGSEWRKAAALDPDDVEATIGLASAEDLDGHDAVAVELASRAAAVAPERPEPWLILARGCQRLGRSAAAADASERLVKLAPAGKPWDQLLDTLPGEARLMRHLARTSEFASSAKAEPAEIPVKLESGYVYLDVEIAGETIPVVFDTGGSNVLSLDDVVAKRLHFEKVADVPVRGASGKADASTGVIDACTVGDVALAHVPTVVFDLHTMTQRLPRPFLGVLGVGWLQQRAVVVDYQKKTLTVESPAISDAVGRPARAVLDEVDGRSRLRVPFWLVGDSKIVFEVEVGGDSALALLDTGSPAIFLSKRFVTDHTPPDKLASIPPLGGGVGSGEAAEQWVRGSPIAFRLGGREFPVPLSIGTPSLDRIVSPAGSVEVSLLLGSSFLTNAARFRIDYANRVLTLEGLKARS
jgi:Flp pilus assembly protein TadD